MQKIPYAFLPPVLLQRYSRHMYGVAQWFERRSPTLQKAMMEAEWRIAPVEYLSMCFVSIIFLFVIMLIFGFFMTSAGMPLGLVPIVASLIAGFAFLQQLMYPKLVAARRVKDIEKNLMPALHDIYVQLNSGINLFNILANVAKGDYGGVSREFDRAVREISAGRSQIEALEDIAIKNPSVLFRRSIWQLVNGMKEGADISGLIGEVIRTVNDEQMIQIQRYGGQLSPLALFYMLVAIIAPSLGTTFIIILSSFISLSELVTKLIFWGLLVLTVFFQIMFLGMIKTRRPALMS